MQHIYAKRWTFSLTLEALTDVHVGTGELHYEEIDGELREVLVQAKCVNKRAYIPSPSLKGALRATAKATELNAAFLFGGESGEETPQAGRLVLFGATLDTPASAGDAPHFDLPCATYTRPQHARDRDSRTVLPRYLYHVENIPAGSTFKLDAMYFEPAGKGNSPEEVLKPLLDRLAAEDGFSIGAQKTTLGRMRLTDKNVKLARRKIIRKERTESDRTCVDVSIETDTDELIIEPTPRETETLTLTAPGPLLIHDPLRNIPPEGSERKEVIRELRYEDGVLMGWERALRQSLRSLSGYLETTIDWASRDRIDNPFIPYKKFEKLCSTQRLFGVEGFRGLLSLHVFSATHTARHEFPGLELDNLTQGALDEASFLIIAPVGGTIKAVIQLDRVRYARLLKTVEGADRQTGIRGQDKAILDRLNTHIRRFGLQAGAKVTRGFGWFEPFDPGLNLSDTKSEVRDAPNI